MREESDWEAGGLAVGQWGREERGARAGPGTGWRLDACKFAQNLSCHKQEIFKKLDILGQNT